MNEGQISRYPSTIYRVSLKAVIRSKDGKILACKEYDSQNWSLPGGGWDHGETEQEALARELKEEVNYTGMFTAKPVATAIFWAKTHGGWLLWIVYEVETENMQFGVGVDTNEVSFIDPKEFVVGDDSHSQWLANYFDTKS